MTRILAREDDRLRVCEIEKELPAPAYTVDTLTALLRDHPCHRFVFLMGEDSSQALRTWKEPERIFQMVEVAVLAREGFEADPAWPCCVIRGESHPAQSRLIRRDLSRGLLPQDLTNSLLEYVRQEGLYSGGEES
jgi:nicotinate-nucleotide adenylyltransferase